MQFDTHTHTNVSTDSRMEAQEALDAARALGLGIIFTEHMDLHYPGDDGEFCFEPEAYFEKYALLRAPDVGLGVEIGMRAECLEENRRLTKQYSFDYILGSIHVLDNQDIYRESFYRGRDKQSVYREYFAAMLENIRSHDFIHSLAHVDYIARYARYPDPEVYYEEFAEYLDAIFRILAERSQALEINTRRFAIPGVAANLLPLYRRFAELGGRYVTIGSDAHHVKHIGYRFQDANDLADACHLQVVYFANGQQIKIAR